MSGSESGTEDDRSVNFHLLAQVMGATGLKVTQRGVDEGSAKIIKLGNDLCDLAIVAQEIAADLGDTSGSDSDADKAEDAQDNGCVIT